MSRKIRKIITHLHNWQSCIVSEGFICADLGCHVHEQCSSDGGHGLAVASPGVVEGIGLQNLPQILLPGVGEMHRLLHVHILLI